MPPPKSFPSLAPLRVQELLVMVLETYLDSKSQLTAPLAVPTKVVGGFVHSWSNVLFQKNGQTSFGNSLSSIARMAQLNVGFISGDRNLPMLSDTTNSGLSAGTSSLITDADSALSRVTHLQQNTNTKMESFINFPSMTVALSSNDLSISGSSLMDGSSTAKHTSHKDQSCQQVCKRQQQRRGFTAASQSISQTCHSFRIADTKQVPCVPTEMHKKSRFDLKQDDFLHQQIVQLLLQRPDSLQLQTYNPQLRTLIQQNKLRNQQQILPSIPRSEGFYMQQQQQLLQKQEEMWHHMHHASPVKNPYDGSVCAGRFMQYMYHLRHRPPDNSILYWRKFVAEYYAPCAKKRWCLSLCDNVAHHALGVFRQVARDAWHCDICGSKSGRGLEAIFEALPMLNKINFESGVVDELLFLDMPHEYRLPSGLMILECGKAVQKSVYEQLHVVWEGQLRIIFTHELKILSWEFCVWRTEELLSRRLVEPEVNQLVQVARKCLSITNETGSGRVSQQDLQADCKMFLKAGCQLARNLELQLVGDLGFSKKYVRCLQISQVVDSMKDLMIFSCENNVGPIESLKNYAREVPNIKIKAKQMQGKTKLASSKDESTDGSKLMAAPPGIGRFMEGASQMANNGLLTDSERAALAVTTCYPKLLVHNSLNSTAGMMKEESSQYFECLNNGASALPCIGSRIGVNGLSRFDSSFGSQNMEQHVIQRLVQEMMNNSDRNSVQNKKRCWKVPCVSDQSNIGDLPTSSRGADAVGSGGLGFGDTIVSAATPTTALPKVMRRIDGLKAASNCKTPGTMLANCSFIKREPCSSERSSSD
ncbi:probable transcriptional regulator SLK3 isoform X2 [Malania oleifera]|uniref:probable transcriptional regulator SLK3 isoform X2 n=1 Tax=Malania oleifera TaxID=397392 RepID=UPI0025AE7884|nr:probable transcriptional regulator SLK3 isoform X2 [Malania oleifera]